MLGKNGFGQVLSTTKSKILDLVADE